MKKFSKIFVMVAIALVAFCSFVACKNNAGGGGTNTEPPAYTPLPAGTNGTAGTSATYVEFGQWPQTIKADGVTVDKNTSEKKYVGMFTYYKGSDGEWYCEAQEKAYGTEEQYKYSDGTKVLKEGANSFQWFKVEPIKWRVLANNYNGKKLLFAESGLMASVRYYDNTNSRTISGETIFPNNYEHSRIRAWLNGLNFQLDNAPTNVHSGEGFLQTAFTAEEQAKIAQTVVDNSVTSTGYSTNTYACDNTNDKVFLLSYSEITANTYFADNSTRIRKPTDFALANYAFKSSNAAYGGWFFLRSPHDSDSNNARNVSAGGGAHYTYVSSETGVVAPALCVE